MVPIASRSARRVALLACVGLLGLAARVATAPREKKPATPPAPAKAEDVARLSVVELIDRLQDEAEEGIGTHSTAWACGFLPVDEEAGFGGGILGSAPPHKSNTMTELVRRGVRALPALLDHLADARPTKLTVGKGFTGRWFADEYDARSHDPRKAPAGVNQLGYTGTLKPDRQFETYNLKVGDFCYVAVGQIVNRGLSAVRYQPTLCLVVNSPVHDPALASAVKADWGGLTAETHERSLSDDALDPTSPGATSGALARLLYYYPPTGRALALKLLNRPLFDASAVYDFLDKKLLRAAPERWSGLLQQYRREHGEAAYRGVEWGLLWWGNVSPAMAAADPERARLKRGCDGVLTRCFPELRRHQPRFLNAATCDDQEGLVRQLSRFQWTELDAATYRLYERAAAAGAADLGAQLERDDLALACAERLRGKGHDAQFRSLFQRRLRQVQRELVLAKKQEKSLAPGDAGYGPALQQRIDFYREFIRRLAR